MIVAQNHARIYNVVVEVDFRSFQRQPSFVGVAVEPSLIQAVPDGFAVVVRITDVEHHRCVLPEKLFQYARDNPKHVAILRSAGLTVVGDEEMVCTASQKKPVLVEPNAIQYSVLVTKRNVSSSN